MPKRLTRVQKEKNAGRGVGLGMIASNTEPDIKIEGQQWFDKSENVSKVWVETSPGVGSWEASSSGGIETYSTQAGLPLTGNEIGDLVFAQDTDSLYLWNNGWFKIELVNQAPAIGGILSSYTLATDGTPTVITVSAVDPEGFTGQLTYGYAITSGSVGSTATISQGGSGSENIFTITPSTSEADEGSFEITFSVSDGVNTAYFSSTIELLFSIPPGGIVFTTTGSHSWTVPAGVSRISVVAVGGGGGSGPYQGSGNGPGSSGGAGGALAYKNDWTVTPGQTVSITVGAGGQQSAGASPNNNGGASTVSYGGHTLTAGGGQGGTGGSTVTTAGGTPSGHDGGGSGGTGNSGGPDNGDDGTPGAGGGAGGYSGNGGNGGKANGSSGGSAGSSGSGGGGGGGGGGNGTYEYSAGGGGVGLYGQGANGSGGGSSTTGAPNRGGGGSGGSSSAVSTSGTPPTGGNYGGGAGGAGGTQNQTATTGYNGGQGAVRIIWGDAITRNFPSTNVSSAASTSGETSV